MGEEWASCLVRQLSNVRLRMLELKIGKGRQTIVWNQVGVGKGRRMTCQSSLHRGQEMGTSLHN